MNIVQSVTLMGGAINFDGIGKELKWRRIFGQTVAGSLRNIYSTKDYVLLGYSISHSGKASGGRNHLEFEEKKACEVLCYPSTKLFNFKNLNISNLAFVTNGKVENFDSGHLTYRGEIMYKVLEILSYY